MCFMEDLVLGWNFKLGSHKMIQFKIKREIKVILQQSSMILKAEVAMNS